MPSKLARTLTFALLLASGTLFERSAHAQLEPLEPAPPQPYGGAPQAPAAPQQPEPSAQPEYMAEGSLAQSEPTFETTDNWGEPSDHQRVVGRLAIAYLGVRGIPAHDGTPDSDNRINAPMLGIRYWFNEGLGLDAGLGIGLESNSGTTKADSNETDLPGSSLFGLGLHLGLPISPWSTAHYNAVLIPELGFAFATGSSDGTTAGTEDDLSLSGLLFQVGFRAGAEFHLEVLDLPQATIQLTVGLGLAFEQRGAEDEAGANGETLNSIDFATNLVSLGTAVSTGIQVFFYL